MSHESRTPEQQAKYKALLDAAAGNGAALDIIVTQAVQGENTSAVNLGDQSEVFKDEVSDTLRFRTLKEGANVSLTQNENDIEIGVTIPPIPPLTEQYYKASAPGDTSSDSYVQIDDNDFTVAAGNYWIDVSAQFGGNKKKNFGVRIKVDGNIIGELTWKGAEDSDSRSMSLIEELNGKAAGTLTVSLEAKCDDGGPDQVFIEQWAVRLRKK